MQTDNETVYQLMRPVYLEPGHKLIFLDDNHTQFELLIKQGYLRIVDSRSIETDNNLEEIE